LLKLGKHIFSRDSGGRTCRGLEKAQPEDLAAPQISPHGQGIHFPMIDADIYVPALLLNTASR
jgi:hypothetical protein